MEPRTFFRNLAAAALLLAAPLATAFPINPGTTVVEFVNDGTGHYLLLTDAEEIRKVETGGAGPLWRRTGFQFEAFRDPAYGVPVCRFYAFGPNSHFYTANAAECAALKADGGGWIYEKSEFSIAVPVNGSCGGSIPVWRFYNNRFMFNDSNHRFTADAGVRDEMRARGWIDEGIAFCTAWAAEVPSQSYAIATAQVRPSAECEDESVNVGSCIALNQLPRLPNAIVPFFPPWYVDRNPLYADAFSQITGTTADLYTAQAPGDSAAVASHAYVQAFSTSSPTQGIHVVSADRTVGDFSSINPLFQFHTNPPAAGEVDPRVFPWRDAGNNEVVLSFDLTLATLRRDDAASQAYGHPTLEFIDQASGEHLYVTLATYGTQAAADFVARDTTTGRVIVSTTFRADPMFGKRYSGDYLRCDATATSATCTGTAGSYRFGIDRAGFQRVLDLARGANARLSGSPGDYFLRNFHFNNEVYREGRIGMTLMGYRLEIFDR